MSEKQLTWADVKVGDVFKRRGVGIGYKMTEKYCLWQDGTSSSAGTVKDVECVIGNFDELNCKLNLEYPGFTIPDEVMDPEKIDNLKPQAKPAVEFEATVEPERVNVGHNDTPEDDAVGELIEYLSEREIPNGELRSIVTKARDQYGQQQKPTIPQEVRECLGHLHIEVCGRGTINITHGDAAHQAIRAALQALGTCDDSHGNRYEPPKPHPLTKVRELVGYVDDFIHNNGKRYGMFETLHDAARRELQEYDGAVDSGQSGSEVKNGQS